RGGDHSAYNQLGFTAVGFRESRENFTRQHDVRDTYEGISLPYLAQNARVNAAAAATLAFAPPPPNVLSDRNQPLITRAPSGYDANLKWAPSPGAAAYRIFWRDAWGPDWQSTSSCSTSVMLQCATRPLTTTERSPSVRRNSWRESS